MKLPKPNWLVIAAELPLMVTPWKVTMFADEPPRIVFSLFFLPPRVLGVLDDLFSGSSISYSITGEDIYWPMILTWWAGVALVAAARRYTVLNGTKLP
jgi:hypothetical protein